MKIAIDFDGTLWEHGGATGPNRLLFEAARTLQGRGHKIILWTCRYEGHGLEDALRICNALGLTFDAVNDNLPETKALFGDPRKIVADVYIDDRCAHPTAIDGLLLALQTRGAG